MTGPSTGVTVVRRLQRVTPGPLRYSFPDPRNADEHGLVAVGGDFEPSTLLGAYRQGIFPWPHGEQEHLWWSPDPRMVLRPADLHMSRRLARLIRQGRFRVTVDAAFGDVVAGCRARADGTWISANLAAAFGRLHEQGWAHSVETWDEEGRLAGGLYGLGLGALFAAESMFFRERDASKVALAGLVERCRAAGVELIDAQMPTPHLASLGFRELGRDDYLEAVQQLTASPVSLLDDR